MFIDFAALAVCPSLSHRKAFFGIVIIVIKAFISFSLGQLQKKSGISLPGPFDLLALNFAPVELLM